MRACVCIRVNDSAEISLCVCVCVPTTTNLGYCVPNLDIQAAHCGVNVSTPSLVFYVCS